MMRKIMLNVAAVAAVAGWIVAFLSMSESSDLEDRLAATKAKLSEASERPCASLRRSPDRSCPKILYPVSPPLSGAGVLVFKNTRLANQEGEMSP